MVAWDFRDCQSVTMWFLGVSVFVRVLLFIDGVLGDCYGADRNFGDCQGVAIWFLGFSVIVRVLLCIDWGLGWLLGGCQGF